MFKWLYKIYLGYLQNKVNKEYEKKGLTDDILKKQIRINSIRYKKNIPDETEFIYENFVQ